MPRSARWAFIVLGGALVVAILLDRLVITRLAPALSDSLGVETSIILFGTAIAIPRFGAVLPIALVVLALLGMMIPYGSFKRPGAWSEAFRRFRRVMILLVLTPVLLMVGGFAFEASKEYSPDFLNVIVEGFGFGFTVFIFEHELLLLKASLATLLGLLVGIFLFYRLGLRRLVAEVKSGAVA